MLQSIKVLVVDDSALMRRVITRLLETHPDIRVVDTAADGEEAIRKVVLLRPDVVTMDVEMPGMGGVQAVSRLMREHPLPIIMLSSHTTEGARVTMEALTAGAIDFIAKPQKSDVEKMAAQLARKIRVVCNSARQKTAPRPTDPQVNYPSPKKSLRPEKQTTPLPMELVVIGSSTGGPAALQVLLPALPANFPCGIVVVQHIPVGFSGPMAEHLNRRCSLEVLHAGHGDLVLPGRVLVAPAGYDLFFRRYGGRLSVALEKGNKPVPPGGFRPSVDVVMTSAAEIADNRLIGVLLTGMGRDGARGMLAIKKRSGYTIAQDENTSVVYGMPKAAADLGAVEKILPLPQIAGEVRRWVTKNLRQPSS
ncbi:MAG TPA: chemotaxis response regulator protein-glutamate methylesterase [Desulfotomaculum sp.]|nr:MAG: chemotaxis protein CheB [Desulfotomaculum sp. BICA1-6]HBX22731.1 chemotaxis response regulator protein-glutamate methylesterase [Desulfotomaculum sp.]